MFAFRCSSATPMTTRRWPIRSCSGFVLWGIRVWHDEASNRAANVRRLSRHALRGRRVRGDDHADRSRLQECQNEIKAALNWGKPFFCRPSLAQTQLSLGLELQMGDVQAVMRWQMDEGSYARKLGRALASYAEAGNEAPAAGPPAAVPHASAPAPSQPTPAPVPPSHLACTLPATPTRSSGWRSARTGGCWPPPATTTRRGCGTRPPATACARVRLLASCRPPAVALFVLWEPGNSSSGRGKSLGRPLGRSYGASE
jgi:hypothetical protein